MYTKCVRKTNYLDIRGRRVKTPCFKFEVLNFITTISF